VKRYRETTAVDGLSITLQPGEVVGLVGPNGAGKTTALRCISGVVRPTDGRIRVVGYDVRTHEREAKQRLAFLAELPNPYELLTVWEHMQFVAIAYGTEDILKDRGEEILHRLRLLDRRNDLVLTLSKGMKQKLAAACAFIHDAKVYLLDEPLMGSESSSRWFEKQPQEAARPWSPPTSSIRLSACAIASWCCREGGSLPKAGWTRSAIGLRWMVAGWKTLS